MKKALLMIALLFLLVTRTSAKESAFLKELSFTNATLTTEFDPLVTTYTALVEEGTISLGVEYDLVDPYASLLIKGNDNLLQGGEVIIRVTSSDNNTMDYRILVSTIKDEAVINEEDQAQSLEVPVTKNTHPIILAILIAGCCIGIIATIFYILFVKRKAK